MCRVGIGQLGATSGRGMTGKLKAWWCKVWEEGNMAAPLGVAQGAMVLHGI